MNKKLMALSLVIGMSFSQMPLQAGIFGGLALPRMNIFSSTMNVVKEHPLLSALTVSGIALGLVYWYNRNLPNKKVDTQSSKVCSNPHMQERLKGLREQVMKDLETLNLPKNEIEYREYTSSPPLIIGASFGIDCLRLNFVKNKGSDICDVEFRVQCFTCTIHEEKKVYRSYNEFCTIRKDIKSIVDEYCRKA